MKKILLVIMAALLVVACGGDEGASAGRKAPVAMQAPDDVWTFIADEWQPFQVSGTQTVRYGQGTTWIERSVTGAGMCTNAFLGTDPLPGIVKRCEVLETAPPPAEVWTFIADEWQPFTVSGTRTVRYGQGTTWIQRSVTGAGMCTNTFFGQDPLPGIVKRCEVLETTPPPAEVWTFIADEWQPFTVSGTQTVRYGQGTVWIQRSVTGSGVCSNTFFGQDPLVGVVKRCEVLVGTPPPAVNTANDGSPLGTNLVGIAYFGTQVPFIDLFKSSAAWISGNANQWDDGRSFDVDSDGWVKSLQTGQVARTVMLRGPGVYPSGKYVVLYEGEGTMVYSFGWRKLSAESSPGRDVVEAPTTEGNFGLDITATNPANYLRNIRVLLPGGICGSDVFVRAAAASDCTAGNFTSFEQNYASLIFNPLFLERTRKYKVLRFMDWMESTTDHQDGTWANRPRLTQARWSGQGGVPLEALIELANRLNAYPWFNTPFRANDDYVRNFAQMVLAKLDPGLKVYLEYSNETWNPDYAAAAYSEAQAQALGIAVPGDAYTTRIRFHARRAPQISDIWASVFGGYTRLQRVLGGQLVSLYLTDVVAGFENAYLKADALGVNAYIDLLDVSTTEDAERFAALTNPQAFAEVRAKSLPVVAANIRAQIAALAKYKLKLVAFEGGNSLWPPYPARSNVNLEVKLTSMQRDPEMKALYTEFLEDWFVAGGQVLMHLTDVAPYSAQGGWFGSLEYVAQTRAQAPKFDALSSFIENNKNRITP